MFTIKLAFILMTVISIRLSSTETFDKDLVSSFFKIKYLQFGYIFGCFSAKERINFEKLIMQHNLRITVNNVNDYTAGFIMEAVAPLHHSGIVVDSECANTDTFLKKAGELLLFDDVHHWLITVSNESILTNLSLNINADVYGAILNTKNNRQNWTVFDVYNPAYNHGGKLRIDKIGFYNKEEGFKIRNKGNTYWKRRNMTGVTFKTEIVLREPFKGTLDEYLEYSEDRSADTYSRFHCKLIYYCKGFYNFSSKINVTDTWGYEFAKGKFDGMTGSLLRKEIDFGCTALYIKPERLPIVDFARGLWNFRVKYIFRQPIIRSFGQTFLRPMATSVWLATLFATLLIILTLKLNQKFEFYILQNLKNTLDHAWSTVIIFALGAFCQQGSPQTPVLLCGRIVTISILIFCLLFYQFYSGSIVSFLLTKPPPTIKNPNDLLKSPLKVASDGLPYLRDYFHTTTNPVAIALYKEKIMGHGNTSNFYPPEYGLKLAENGDFAYQVEKTTAYKIIRNSFSDRAICELGELEVFPESTLLTALQKKSPFRDMFNFCIQRLAEHGIGDYEAQHWGAGKPDCLPSSHSILFRVGLKEIYPAIVLLNIGILISLMILGIEIFMKEKIKKVQTENKTKTKLPSRLLNNSSKRN